jgi:cell division transport system permease protein
MADALTPARKRRGRRNRSLVALRFWLGRHATAAAETLDRLIRTPLATAMTVAAIAIALALPTTLVVVLDNLERLGGGWQHGAAMSLFLKPGIDEQRGAELAGALRSRIDIAAVDVISRAQGLAEFREYSGLGGALDQLNDNPLPVVLAIYPTPDVHTEAELAAMADALEALPDADFARLDTQWTQRFQAIIALLRNGALLLASVLGLAVLLVVGNTIRLEIENRRNEVQIMDLVGATRAFIRRPFLYSGAWYGLLGSMLAWIMVTGAIQLLQRPVEHLASLYHTQFSLSGLGGLPSVSLLAGGALLGTVGAWVAVGRHLNRVEPQ